MLDLKNYQEGIHGYWRVIGCRSLEVQRRESAFTQLADRFLGQKPPHFTREDLVLILEWKHTDARWRNRALDGLKQVADDRLIALTRQIGGQQDLNYLLPWLRGAIYGVGIASISAILTAARPDRFCVIDEFSLRAIDFHYHPMWLRRDKNRKFVLDEKTYIEFVSFCRKRAVDLTPQAGKLWTPRDVEMALWAIGKELD
jgi:hypothetical protein